MAKIRTVTEAKEENLYIPRFCDCENPDEFLLVHDPNDGSVLAWGPSWDRETLENLAKAFD